MHAHRIVFFLAALAAVAAGPAVPGARADSEKDSLAEGDWKGEKDWQHMEKAWAPGDPATPSNPGGAPPAGTPTPPCGGAPAVDPGAPGACGPDDDDDPPVVAPSGPPAPAGQPEPQDPGAGGGFAPGHPVSMVRWVCDVTPATPSLYDKETILTLVLFRMDAFAFICNGFARSESTWYVDWFATTTAQHDDVSQFQVVLRLEGGSADSHPRITLEGVSALEAKAQVMTQWGGVDESTGASACASTAWAGDVDCSDNCSAAIAKVEGSGQAGVGFGGVKITMKENKSYVYVNAPGGKPAAKLLYADRTDLMIVNRGSVSTYAAGTEDNAQAKCRVGYYLKIRGETSDGTWGEFQVRIDN